MANDIERVNQELRNSVQSDDSFLTEVAIHLINAGGKRVRPALSITTSLISENEPETVDHDVIRGGVAVELVHQGSLYHDDVMDGAKTRRNVESVNSKWGNREAILAGDFLLARAGTRPRDGGGGSGKPREAVPADAVAADGEAPEEVSAQEDQDGDVGRGRDPLPRHPPR